MKRDNGQFPLSEVSQGKQVSLPELNAAGRKRGGWPHLWQKTTKGMVLDILTRLNRISTSKDLAYKYRVSKQRICYVAKLLRREGADIPIYPIYKVQRIRFGTAALVIHRFKVNNPEFFPNKKGEPPVQRGTLDFGNGIVAGLSLDEVEKVRKHLGIPKPEDIPGNGTYLKRKEKLKKGEPLMKKSHDWKHNPYVRVKTPKSQRRDYVPPHLPV